MGKERGRMIRDWLSITERLSTVEKEVARLAAKLDWVERWLRDVRNLAQGASMDVSVLRGESHIDLKEIREQLKQLRREASKEEQDE